MGTPLSDFAEFYRGSADECLRAVLVSVGDLDTAQDAAVLGAAAAAAVAVTVLPASHPAANQPSVRLAAWSVVRQPGGNLAVTIRELYDPAGLQRQLRADGVPAAVTFSGRHPHLPCRPYPANRALMSQVFPSDVRDPYAAVEIRPFALPTGAAVYINDTSNPDGYLGLTVGLVYAGQHCTRG